MDTGETKGIHEERAQEEREQERENEVTKQTGRGYN